MKQSNKIFINAIHLVCYFVQVTLLLAHIPYLNVHQGLHALLDI